MTSSSLILIVDDDQRGRLALESTFTAEGYSVRQAANGFEALALAHELQPDVVLLDVMMPDLDGFDVCRRLRADTRTAEVPIILVTALDDSDARLQGIDAGADELLTKPFNRLELRTRIRALTRVNRYRRLVREREALESASQGVISLLTDILSLTDPEGCGRTQQVRDRALALEAAAGQKPNPALEIAALLCRLGRITVPPSVQAKAKRAEPLTAAEENLWSRVPEIGSRMLAHLPQFAEVAEIIRWQDARYDGGETTAAIRGESLPASARVLKVALDLNDLEAAGVSPAEAWDRLAERSGWYDPAVLAAAKHLLEPRQLAGGEIREVRFGALECGWKLHQDILAPDGTLLLGAGHVISPLVLESIQNFAAITGIKEPLVVEVPPAPGPVAPIRPPG